MLKRFLSLVLLVVFITETSPDALLHLLTHHEDTRDHNYSETVLSSVHVHCAALQQALPAFDKVEPVSAFAPRLFSFAVTSYNYKSISSKFEEVSFLRGPPVC